MRQMGWSWDQLQATPAYVRRYAWDLLGLRAAAEQRAYDRANRT